jgi:hypothetical protein
LRSDTTIILKQCFGVAFLTIIRVLATFIIKRQKSRRFFYEEKMQQNNDEEIEAEMRAEFNRIQAGKEEAWRLKGRKKPGKPAS